MRPATHAWRFVVAAAAIAFGCGKPPAPRPPPPPPPPVVEAPPPPPKCEAVSEACAAKPGTTARIQATGWKLQPPPGWTYAQEEDATVALSQGAALAVIIYDVPDKKHDAARRDQMASDLTKKLGVQPAKKKKLAWPKKPDSVMTVGALKVALYQFDGATRETKKGPLLVFSAKLPDGKGLLGVGFVPEDDGTKADEAILKTIESLTSPAPAEATPPAAPKEH